MTPDKDRGASPAREPLENTAAAKPQVRAQDTPQLGQPAIRRAELVNVWAHGFYTVGTRGRIALTMVVPICVFCGRAHRHNGKPDFTGGGKRTASCGQGRYVVHLGTVEGEVAA